MSPDIDRKDPGAVAKAAVEAIIAKDYDRIAELTFMTERDHENFKQEGTTYQEMLELMFEFGDDENPDNKPLPAALKDIYNGELVEVRVGEVPRAGKIAVGNIGPVDEAGERVMVVIMNPYEDGTWAMQHLPKMMPAEKLDDIKS